MRCGAGLRDGHGCGTLNQRQHDSRIGYRFARRAGQPDPKLGGLLPQGRRLGRIAKADVIGRQRGEAGLLPEAERHGLRRLAESDESEPHADALEIHSYRVFYSRLMYTINGQLANLAKEPMGRVSGWPLPAPRGCSLE